MINKQRAIQNTINSLTKLLTPLRPVRANNVSICTYLCNNMDRQNYLYPLERRYISKLLTEYFPSWDDYSGNIKFPVKGDGIGPAKQYYLTDEYYEGTYGQRRLNLVKYLIQRFEQELTLI